MNGAPRVRPQPRWRYPCRVALAAAFAPALALAGCAAGSTADGSATATAAGEQAAANSEITPMTEAELEALLATSAAEHLVPGAFAAVVAAAGMITASTGSTLLDAERRPTAEDVFRIGSVTKTMTSITVLQLADEGALELTDPIERFIPRLPGGTDITIADLLQMRSGLQNYLDTDGFAAVFDTDMTHVWTPGELVAFGVAQPAVAAPGTAFDYSNSNTILLGMVAEQLDGMPLAQIFRERLFAPLGMHDTELPSATEFALPNPEVQGYQYGVFPINHRSMLSETERDAARAGALQPHTVTRQSSSWSWAAGGVTSTAADLLIWARALASGELLSARMHEQWLADVAPMDPERGENGPQYGLGIEQARFGANRIYLHEGELPGFNTMVATDPANGVSFVIWANLALSIDGAPNAKAIAGDLIDALYVTKLGAPVVDAAGG